jgi:hypothetical protein
MSNSLPSFLHLLQVFSNSIFENGFVCAGWVARFYVDGSVPSDIITQLKGRGAEIVVNDNIKGGIAGMFWRFLIADDPTVDR